MQLVVFVLLPAVLLVNAQEPSCANTRTSFHNVGEISNILSSLTPQAGSLCQLSATCCSLDAETAFKERTVHGYEVDITSRLSQGLRTCQNHSVLGAMASYIAENKVQLEDDVTLIYGIFFTRYLGLFDRFFAFLAESVHTGDMTDLPTEFHQMFFELYLAAFLSNPNAPSSLPNTEEFRDCFYNIFLEQESHRIRDFLRGFERSWNLTMRYFRALKAMDRVVSRVLSQQGLTEQCQVSLMRMTDCARCAGFPDSTHSCNGLCLNTMRGCLVDLGDLVEPMQAFSQALIGMKDRVLTFNPFHQVTLLQSHVFTFLSASSGSFYSTYSQIDSRCHSLNGRRRREAAGEEPVPGGKPRVARSVISPVDVMNESAHCLLNNMALFSHLPDTLCGGEGVSAGNENCWNGRQLGSYSRSVVEFTRALQVNNPEVLMCPRVQYSRFSAEIRLLRYMTQELNALTGVCSDDDEDCLVVLPTTTYYDLDSIVVEEPTSTSTEEVEESSGSGSDVDACQPPTSAPVTITAAATTAAPVTVSATTATPTTSLPTTETPTTSAPTTETLTSSHTTETPTTSAPTTVAATTAATTTVSIPPVSSTGSTGIVVEPTGSHTVPVPGGEVQTDEVPVDIDDGIETGVPGEIAGEQGSGSGDGSINGSRGLLPSSLTVYVGLIMTVLSLATPSSHSH